MVASVLQHAQYRDPSTQTRLRRLLAPMIDALRDQLATSSRSALRGAPRATPTRRRGRSGLHLAATLRANAHTLHRAPDGRARWVPAIPWFREQSARFNPLDVFLLVDVSGSMATSTVYAALLAHLLAQAGWAKVHFYTFSTEVADLSDHLDDLLHLLLTVRVGGGTHIANALQVARGAITRPHRSVVALISDFEEGGPLPDLLSEVSALSQSGVTLLGLAAHDPGGQPVVHRATAQQVAEVGMPVASLPPEEWVAWIAERAP